MITPTTDANLLNRFLSKVSKTDTCWLWEGSLNNRGYGQMRILTRSYLAHRVSYKIFKTDIPAGKVIDHLCSTTACVNPEHLEAVTFRENVLRGKASNKRPDSLKKFCIRGHEFTHQNTYTYSRQGRIDRGCKQCRVLASKKLRNKGV
jgi:HNH endonuclease